MLRVETFSEAGGHPANEDAFRVQAHPLDPECWLAFVADGQGGRAGGAAAAHLACEAALAAALEFEPRKLIDARLWPNLLHLADTAVKDDATAGFTTLVGLCVYGQRLVGASSGDSAALLCDVGHGTELTAAQRKNPPIGSGAAIAVSFAAGFEPGARLLLLTDGVWKYSGWERVLAIASRCSGRTIIDELQQRARLPGSGQFQDDFTVVVLEATR
jgi:serine/threonine protein phosphatase PrpC